jgi:hypothetical protein
MQMRRAAESSAALLLWLPASSGIVSGGVATMKQFQNSGLVTQGDGSTLAVKYSFISEGFTTSGSFFVSSLSASCIGQILASPQGENPHLSSREMVESCKRT